VSIHQPDRNLQILAAFRQRFAGHFDHVRVVGRFEGGFPLALGGIDIFPPGFFNLVGNRIVAQIRATGILTGNGVEQIVAKGHTGPYS
jgi:hypothetical protein